MKDISISIIVPNYNYGRFLPRLFTSLCAQSRGLSDVEVIVIDDGSTDDSVAVANELGATLGAAEFRVVRMRHSGRPGTVRNVGLARACGRFMLCLDPDDEVAPQYLGATLAALEGCPQAGMAVTDYELAEGDDVRVIRVPEFDPDILRTQNPYPSVMLFRREVYERCGGYRDDTAYEDWELWVRAASAGFRVVRVERTLFRYNFHAGNYSQTARRDDARAKAALVLANRRFFDAQVVAWARGVERGEPWAVGFGRGLIPRAEDVRTLRGIAERVAGEMAAKHREGEVIPPVTP
ncbi:glycosyltransferase involved in cell wall biosynthesis [Desulfobaculum xiamenense]|uniref:Glycosyltransferase involved in cell wall biosynthesis n=1 Tax=Desulfobaculum xiamenense TaxID=995050 RepID=A0A846QDX1_9BACT|nr:glycosyltransferase involved in cell wall biosynthesis [Desulfobaculum xiamenense]